MRYPASKGIEVCKVLQKPVGIRFCQGFGGLVFSKSFASSHSVKTFEKNYMENAIDLKSQLSGLKGC